MSLQITLRIGDEPVGECTVRRIDPLDVAVPVPDARCIYEVDAHDDRTGNRFTSVVEHRYGDGPWELARAALGHVADLTGRRSTGRP